MLLGRKSSSSLCFSYEYRLGSYCRTAGLLLGGGGRERNLKAGLTDARASCLHLVTFALGIVFDSKQLLRSKFLGVTVQQPRKS